MDPLLAMIFAFGGNFAPQGYQFCSGQLLTISSNAAMFSLLGTTYGGNGTSNFALPDLRGRVPVGQGQGPLTSNYVLGQSAGVEAVTLTTGQLPSHSHTAIVNTGPGNAAPGGTTYLSAGPSSGSGPNASVLNMYTTGQNIANIALSPGTIGATGGGQSVPLLQPYLAITYIIAINGIFPTRN